MTNKSNKTKKSLCPILGISKPRRYAVSVKAWDSLPEKTKTEMCNPRKGTLRQMAYRRGIVN